jgi:hypothetical protein
MAIPPLISAALANMALKSASKSSCTQNVHSGVLDTFRLIFASLATKLGDTPMLRVSPRNRTVSLSFVIPAITVESQHLVPSNFLFSASPSLFVVHQAVTHRSQY